MLAHLRGQHKSSLPNLMSQASSQSSPPGQALGSHSSHKASLCGQPEAGRTQGLLRQLSSLPSQGSFPALSWDTEG